MAAIVSDVTKKDSAFLQREREGGRESSPGRRHLIGAGAGQSSSSPETATDGCWSQERKSARSEGSTGLGGAAQAKRGGGCTSRRKTCPILSMESPPPPALVTANQTTEGEAGKLQRCQHGIVALQKCSARSCPCQDSCDFFYQVFFSCETCRVSIGPRSNGFIATSE